VRKPFIKFLGLLCLIILATASCAPGGSSEGPASFQVIDQLGRVVTFEKAPERIISLAPSNTELLFALGLGDKIVGVTDWCDYPSDALEKDKVGGFSTPNIETIVALEPDLIVAANIHQTEVIPQLENLGLTVLALNPQTVDEVVEAIEMAGNATGMDAAAELLVEDIESRKATVESLVSELAEEEIPRVFYIIWHDPLMTVGGNTLQSEVIGIAGGQNIFGDLSDYPTVSLETLLDRDPQVIVVGTGHGEAQSAPWQWVQSETRLDDTEATSEGRVYQIDADLMDLPGPRTIDGIEEMFRLLHPELANEIE
jgi:iron complex transport system substrate-binding protein